MPVVKHSDIRFQDVQMDSAIKTSKANVIGAAEGWKENTLRVFRISSGGQTPYHQHDWEHVIHVMGGRGRVTIGGETFELHEKDFAFIPSNTMHQFKNPYDEEIEFICIVPERGAH
ncbi:MAG: cupin domain-containing protein [candidate division Zixibacteria bacterium]|nr:cupin domain-containing protein [candidate division Zixibacteria bacterium]